MKQQFAMNIVWLLASMILYNGFTIIGVSTNVSTIPEIVNIGAIFSFKSVIGKAEKVAIEAAIEDINSNPDILRGTKLRLQMKDSNYSGFMAIVEALLFMERDTVAVIGPQSSVTDHVISHIANVLGVPLLSFSSTDPTVSNSVPNDLYQMVAIAEIIDHHEWREVIAIYEDDNHGRNGIAALGDKLAERRCRISYKARLSPDPTRDEITDVLVKVALRESRILVVHVPGSWGLTVFSVARYLGMLGTGYVWIATNWLSTILDTNSPLSQDAMDDIQGVVTLRMYTQDSELEEICV
ncbi:hypothetical protein CRYUN_Cryun24cG0000300 [Craigia yunnanensis]